MMTLTEESAAIEAANKLLLIGKPLNEHGAIGLCYAFKNLAQGNLIFDLTHHNGKRLVVEEKVEKCPLCNSHAPHLHPAVQHGGEVEICKNLWHKNNGTTTRPLTLEEVKELLWMMLRGVLVSREFSITLFSGATIKMVEE